MVKSTARKHENAQNQLFLTKFSMYIEYFKIFLES
jgi:hypothetical protein